MAGNQIVLHHQSRGDHSAIEVSHDSKSLAAAIKKELATVSPSPFDGGCCIYRVHEKFRKINEYAYTPEMVAIGPFHHHIPALQAMKDHKLRYMNELLLRVDKAKLEECVEAISRDEDKARKCYSEAIDLDKNEFTKMLIVDSLFIIELFRKSIGEEKTCRGDPIFNNIWGMSSLVRDMILLENQIPMFILDNLFKRTIANQGGKSLNELAIRFFNPLMPREEGVLQNCSNKQGKHLLDLLSTTFLDLPDGGKPNQDQTFKDVPCVTELQHAGVKFKKGTGTSSFLDIRFVNGVLIIPPIVIQDQTESLLRNLIASEQCCDGRANNMTSYAFLMDSLINSSTDVAILRNHGIIRNCLGEDDCVSSLFNKLCSEVTLAKFYYSDLCDKLNAFYKTRWHVWKAALKREHFQNPWAVVSIIAASLLIILTVLATTFAILSFAIHKS